MRMCKRKIDYRSLSYIGLLVFLCGQYFGNAEALICFFIFVLFSGHSIRLLKKDSFTKYQFMFTFLVLVSFIWAQKESINTTTTLLVAIGVVETLYLGVYLYSVIDSRAQLLNILNIVLLSLIFLALDLIIRTPLDVWGTHYIGQAIGVHRNDLGMQMAFGGVITFYYLKEKYHIALNIILFILFSFIVVISGSRTSFAVWVLIISLYCVFAEKNVKVIKNIGIAIILLGIAFYFIMNNSVLYEMLGKRMLTLVNTLTNSSEVSISVDKSIWERNYFREYAIKMFLNKPIFGYGLDGFRTEQTSIGFMDVAYSHCNYTEMLCNFGIVGFVIYYLPKIKLLFISIMKKKSKLETLFFIVLLTYILCDYGTVSYFDIFTQFLFIISFIVLNRSYLGIRQPNDTDRHHKKNGDQK